MEKTEPYLPQMTASLFPFQPWWIGRAKDRVKLINHYSNITGCTMIKVRSNNLSMLLFVIAISLCLLIFGYILKNTLYHPNYLTDNLYNKGVILRSASALSKNFLETSYSHWFFDDSNIVRPEDWHRSLSIIIQRIIAQLFPSNNEFVLKIPHMLWTLLWLFAAIKIYLKLNTPLKANGLYVHVFGIILTIGLLVFNKWSVEILSGAYMDDIPGAAFVLLGILPLLSITKSSKNIAVSSAMFGLAFLAKDFNLIWGGIGLVFVLIYLLFPTQDRTPKLLLSRLLIYIVILMSVYGIKIAWNLYDLGSPLSSAARTALNARLISGIDDGEHFLYIFKGLSVPGYFQIIARNGILSIISAGGKNLLWLVLDQIYTFALLLFGLAVWIVEKNRALVNRFILYSILTISAYSLFFILQLGEASQTRYWLAPFSMVIILFTTVISPDTTKHNTPLPVRLIKISMLLAIALFAVKLAPAIIQEQNVIYMHGKPFKEDIYEIVSENISSNTAVLLDTNRGVFVWSRSPQSNVVAVKPYHLASLDNSEFQRLRDKYKIKVAVFSKADDQNGLFGLLENNGFTELGEFEQDVVFIYR